MAINANIIRVASQGQQGVVGDSGRVVTKTAGQVISALKVVYTDPTTGELFYADYNNTLTAKSILGVTKNSGGIGSAIIVVVNSEMTDTFWNWDMTQNVSLFLGASGAITQGISGGAITARIGYAINSTTIMVRFGEPVINA